MRELRGLLLLAAVPLLATGCLTVSSLLNDDAGVSSPDTGATGRHDASADVTTKRDTGAGSGGDAARETSIAVADAHAESSLGADAGHDAATHDEGGHDAGEHDAGEHDSGEHDAGKHDSGEHDAGLRDSGEHDSGEHDSGEHDSGEHDAGHDAGKCYQLPLTAGVVGWWRGNGNAADVVGGNPGTWTGTPAYVPGVVGQAFSLSSGNAVSAGTKGLPTGAAARTVEFWAQIGKAASSANQQTFLEYGVSTSNELFAVFAGNSNDIDFSQWGSGFTATAAMTIGTWYHIAVTYSGTQALIYVNGVQEGSWTYTIATAASGGQLFIGGAGTVAVGTGGVTDGNNHVLTGLVDELTIYSTVLTAAQIQGIYDAGSAGKCALGM
jgi:hypothetical protein